MASKILIIPLPSISDIDDDGYVQMASTYSDSLNLLGDKLDWLSKDNLLYVTPQVDINRGMSGIKYISYLD